MRTPGVRERFIAAAYDRLSASAEREVYEPRRRELLANARGTLLDLGCGSGVNLPHYPVTSGQVTGLVLLDPSRGMLERAQRRATRLGLTPELIDRDAEHLPFEDETFDTLVCTLVLCTVSDPAAALREAYRVLRPSGHLLVLEHVRARDASVAAWQDRLNPLWRAVNLGCNVNRATRAAVERAGFQFEEVDEFQEPRAGLAIVQPHLEGIARKARAG